MKQLLIFFVILFQIFNLSINADTDQHPWPLYTFEDGTGPIQIRFPKPPSRSETNGSITYTSIETSAFPLVIYNLSYSANETSVDPSDIYEDFLSHFIKDQFVVLQADVDFLEEWCEMNFLVFDPKHRVARKHTIYITEDNVYHLYTLYFLTSVENHAAFIYSFVPFLD